MNVKIINHPVIEHKLTRLRMKNTQTTEFRNIVTEISSLMAYEITRDFELEDIEIETPITKMTAKRIAGKKTASVPILRAGLGMVEGILRIMPLAKIGHVGLYRDEETLEPVTYFSKLPDEMDERVTLLVDPMLATGGSAVAAIDILKKAGSKSIKLVCLVGCPEGVREVNKHHPDVEVFLASLDEKLNEKGYITPGLGDAGDRIFGTM